MSARVRVGIVDYLNAWPLAWGFLTGRSGDAFEPRYLPPAGVADALAGGELDVGLVPSIELWRIDGLTVVPELCVAATHEVRSVLLVSKRPLAEVERMALDHNSRTSAALVRILMRDRYGRDPELVAAAPDAEAMLSSADAALIIGDPALAVDRRRYRVWDLAAEWRALTGLPFVFAVWAVRGGLGDRGREASRALAASLELGLREMPAIVARAVTELELDAIEVRDYLTVNLSFRLDDEALAGLQEFRRRAALHGLIEERAPLALLSDADC